MSKYNLGGAGSKMFDDGTFVLHALRLVDDSGEYAVFDTDAFVLGDACQSLSYASFATGYNTIAGSKCFNITAFDDANKAYTLDSVEGLAVGDVFSLKLFNNYENIGKITNIRGNKVSVDNYHKDEESDVKYFRVPSKPTCGTTDFGIAAFAGGEGCKAIGTNSHASGLNTIANGVCAHTEGRETTANYASHAEGG